MLPSRNDDRRNGQDGIQDGSVGRRVGREKSGEIVGALMIPAAIVLSGSLVIKVRKPSARGKAYGGIRGVDQFRTLGGDADPLQAVPKCLEGFDVRDVACGGDSAKSCRCMNSR